MGLPSRLRLALGVAATAWLVVGTAFWTLNGPSSQAAFTAGVTGAIGLAGVTWWLTSRVPLPTPPGPGFFATHALAGMLLGSVLILVTYGAESWSTGQSLGRLARAADFLGAEFVFWIWLYAVLTAGFYGSRFNAVLRREREATARAEAGAAEARLAALRGRLNPHFLFNALHGVSALIRRDPDRAETAIERLGDLLRTSLADEHATTVRLADEVQFTRTYLELEQLGMGDRLAVAIDVDDSALTATAPPFALQVLAENAVRHGIAPLPAGGRIEIEVSDRGGAVELVVRDSGPGPASDECSRPGGGLGNLRDRLAALYGDAAELAFASPRQGGFVARLRLLRS